MKIFVTVKPNAKRTFFKQEENQNSFIAAVSESPIENRATLAVMELLANHFGVPVSRIHLVSGRTTRKKVFELI